MTTMVHLFGGDATTAERSKELLGGKGSNLAEMASIGLPVPPGFTITTDVCTAYYANGEQFPAGLIEEVAAGIAHIEGITGKTFGDAMHRAGDARQQAEAIGAHRLVGIVDHHAIEKRIDRRA